MDGQSRKKVGFYSFLSRFENQMKFFSKHFHFTLQDGLICRIINLNILLGSQNTCEVERATVTVTIYDVAREAGVSMATVSRVVNNNPNVKPQTRKKVFEAIERLGYRPNAVARGLASKKTTTVGVVIPDISNSIFAEVARGIEDIA